MSTTYVNPPEKCDLCGRSFKQVSVMYDANLRGVGWCNCCHSCFQVHKGTLGVGRGQKYQKQDNNSWLCVKGGMGC